MSRTRVIAPAVAGLALLSACSSSGGATSAGTPSVAPALRVQNASDVTSRAGSLKYSLVTDTKAGAQDVSVKADGAYDAAKQLGTSTVTLGQPGGRALSVDERIVGGALYLGIPQSPGTFYKLSLTDLVGTSFGAGGDPSGGFAALKAAGNVQQVGAEQVRGDATTHYRGTYDVQAALAKVGGAAHDQLSAALKGSSVTVVPFDAWIDAAGRVRRFTQHLTVLAAGQQAMTTSTIETYEFGTTVQAEAPPAAMVKDGALILDALKAPTS